MSEPVGILDDAIGDPVLWHDVECGGYAVDLPLWQRLAAEADGPVLELGCGTGRVSLHLAELGHGVTGVDVDPALVESFNSRAREAGLEARAAQADATELALGRRFGLVLAPMQLLQVVGASPPRRAALAAAAAHLAGGGLLAAAIVDSRQLRPAEHDARSRGSAPLPDVREREGWVFSSLPLGVRHERGGIAIERLRQVVSPDGELRERVDITRISPLSPPQLEAEALAVGLAPRATHDVEATHWHVGSTVCVFEAAR